MLTLAQRIVLVILRTLIGWHFLYEGYFKLIRPAWARTGAPLETWTSASYLRGATGPFAGIFHSLGESAWIGWFDIGIASALVLVGLALMLGIFTRTACAGAFVLLTLFYLSAMPMSGLPEPRSEGAYLLVNKNLIEAAAVLVVMTFHAPGRARWTHAHA